MAHQRGISLLAKKLKYLLVFGKATHLVFRENELPICDDIKDAAGALDQLRLDAEGFGYPGRQTGGLREIVSRYTIGNRDSHFLDPPYLVHILTDWN